MIQIRNQNLMSNAWELPFEVEHMNGPAETCLIRPCSEDGWLEVALHYTGGQRGPKPSEDEEEPALPQKFSGDSVEELTRARRGGASKGVSPVKAATASRDGSSLRRCAREPGCAQDPSARFIRKIQGHRDRHKIFTD